MRVSAAIARSAAYASVPLGRRSPFHYNVGLLTKLKMQQDEGELSSLEQQMRRPDFVLEPKCWETILKYIANRGTPADVVELLSDSFVGYAPMAGLVCRWLRSVMDEDPRTCASSAPWDEFHFLKEFTKQKFDPDKLSDIFTQGGGKPPPWLEGLTADARGRQMIYELSAVHRNCLLLNFAIQKILLQGHDDEVASVGSSLASYFSVFHRLLAARLRAIAVQCQDHGAPHGSAPVASSTTELQALTKELSDSCAQSHHTYLHAQKLFIPADNWPSAGEACGLVGRMLAAAPQLSTTEALKLASMYNSYAPPPLYPIQHPQLLHLLLSSVFAPGKPLSQDAMSACIDLLARATSGMDAVTAHAPPAKTFQATKEALQAALVIGANAQNKVTTANDVQAACQVAAIPVAALGLLHYMRCHLGQRDYYHEAGSLNAGPVFLRLSVFIAMQQPELLDLVVDLLGCALVALGSQRVELSKLFLDAAVVLMRDCHAVEEVMRMVDTWSQTADPSLIRYFLFQLLAAVAPPYSQAFASWVLHHLISSGVRRGRDGHRGSRNAALLAEFATACCNMKLQTAFGSKELPFLQELKTIK